MSAALDHLLGQYESGRLSRRDLLATLTVLVGTGAKAVAQDFSPASAGLKTRATTGFETVVGPVKQMNHVSIFVPDVQKSKQFYQDIFGLQLLTNQDPGVNLSTGPSFLGIYPAPAGASGGTINHLCLGVERFDADGVLKKLTDRGLRARIRQRGDTKELYLTDPDGISVQIQDTAYIGGVGPLGNKKP